MLNLFLIVDKEHIVVVLSDFYTRTNAEFIEKRKEIINAKPILEGTIHVAKPFRPETLHHKAVLILLIA